MTSSTFYMPTRFDSAAPCFDDHDPTTLLPFFDDLELLFTRARISDDQEKKNHARRYAPDRAYDVFAAISQFAAPASYSDFKEAILDLWPGSRNRDRFRRTDLEVLLAKRRCTAIASETDLAEFYRNFLAISEQLIVSQRLCVLEQRRAFATAFDVPLWSAISRRLDILNCDRNPELPPAICDIYEAARHVLRSRKARAHAAPPATFVPVPAKLALSPAPAATASPPSIASAPTIPVIASPRPIAAVAPRRPAVALQPPSLLARPAQVPLASLAPPAPLRVASHPAFAALKTALAPATAVAPCLAKPTSSPLAPVAPSRIVSHYLPGLPRTPRIAPQQSAPAPAPRQCSVEESAKILAAFTWHPPRRVAEAPGPTPDSEMFTDVFATLGDPFEASTPSPDRVARAKRIYSMFQSLQISFEEFHHGTVPEPVISPPTSSPRVPIAYLPPSSPVFASLPKPRPRPRMPPRKVPIAAPIPSLRIASSPSFPMLATVPSLPTTPSLPSLPTVHPTPVSLGELLGVAPGVRDLLRAFLDAIEPAPPESPAQSRPHDAFDPPGVVLALCHVPATCSRSRCDLETPRALATFALRVAQPRYEPALTFIIADPALRTRQASPRAPLRWSSAPSRSMPTHAPALLAFPARPLSPPSPAHSPSLAPSPTLRLSPIEPASSPASLPVLTLTPRHAANESAPLCDTQATLRPSRSSPEQPANTPATAPAHLEAQLSSDSAPRHRVASATPRDASTSPLATRVVSRSSDHISAAPRIAKTAPRPRVDSPAPRVDSAASCPASKVSPASGDTLRVLEPRIICGAPTCHVSVALRHAPPPRSPFAILAAVLRLASSTAPAPRHASPSCSLPVTPRQPRERATEPSDKTSCDAPLATPDRVLFACHASTLRPPLATRAHVSLARRVSTTLRIVPLLRSRLAATALVLIMLVLATLAIVLRLASRTVPRSFATATLSCAAPRAPRKLSARSSSQGSLAPCGDHPVGSLWRLCRVAHALLELALRPRRPGDFGISERDIAPAIWRPQHLRLRSAGDLGLALVAASHQGSRVRSRSRKTSLRSARTPASHIRHRYRLRHVIAPALRNRV